MGIIGTVLGLVHVLQNLAAPSTLGPSISAAFIATLMGVGAANVVFLPIANRLKAISAEEVELRMMTLEGILSIQAGDNPRLVAEKLMSYLPPVERAPRTTRGAATVSVDAKAAWGWRADTAAAAAAAASTRRASERWLLTYADMITLLMALFMVLFSISSVNISKYQVLQQSLRAAFRGSSPAAGIANPGASAIRAAPQRLDVQPILAGTAPTTSRCRLQHHAPPARRAPPGRTERSKQPARNEPLFARSSTARLLRRSHGFANEVQTVIE